MGSGTLQKETSAHFAQPASLDSVSQASGSVAVGRESSSANKDFVAETGCTKQLVAVRHRIVLTPPSWPEILARILSEVHISLMKAWPGKKVKMATAVAGGGGISS